MFGVPLMKFGGGLKLSGVTSGGSVGNANPFEPSVAGGSAGISTSTGGSAVWV